MIIPFLKKNGKFTLYNTESDISTEKIRIEYRIKPDKTSYNEFYNCEYDFIDFFQEGFAKAKTGNNIFFINLYGNILKTKNEYIQLNNFENGIAAVKDFDGWTFINKNGIQITNNKYDEIYRLHKNFIKVNQESSDRNNYYSGLL